MIAPKIMSRADAIEALRFPSLLDNALRAGWLRPVGSLGNHRAGSAVFSTQDVEQVVARILAGEMPPSTKAKTKREAAV